MQLTAIDRKWLQIFKNLVEKTLIPQIQRTNGSMVEWQIFQSLIASPNITQNQIQLFVDSLPINTTNIANAVNSVNKKQKNKVQTITNSNANQQFHPSKTFGGEKSKTAFMEYLGNNNIGSPRESQKDELAKSENTQRNSNFLGGLQKLLKNLQENQIYIDNMCKQNRCSSPKSAFPPLNFVYSSKSSNVAQRTEGNLHRSPPGWINNTSSNQSKI